MQPRLLKHPARLAGASLLRLQDDNRLVALAREGHDPAFAAIVDRYGAQLERYCARLLGPGRAEDAVQQAFVNAHAAMRASDQELALKPWLYRIAHNAALNVLRAAKDESVVLDEDRPGATQTADVVELREQLRETLASIQALPAAQRDALLLREVEGRSHEEIAAALGVTAGGARQHLHRARMSLRAAASAITPYPLLARVLNAAAADGGRGSDLVSGAGLGAGAGAMKACAGVLAAGAIAGGAVTAQHHSSAKSNRAVAGHVVTDRSTTANAAGNPSGSTLNAASQGSSGATSHGAGGHGRPSAHGRRHDGTSQNGRRHASSESHRSGGGDDSAEHKDSTEHTGGSGGSTGTSGKSDDGGLSHSGSGSSGSGSDDTTTTALSDDHSGSGSSGSGSDDGVASSSSGPGSGEIYTTPTSGDSTEPSGSGSGSSGSGDPTTTTTDH